MSGLPAFKAAGTFASVASGAISIAWPTGHAAGDFALLFIGHRGTTTNTVTTPSGWSAVPGDIWGGISPGAHLSVFYRFATSGSMANVSPTWSGSGQSDISAIILTYTGVNIATPIHAQSPGCTSSVTAPGPIYIPGATTVLGNCLGVLASSFLYSSGTAPFTTSVANSDLSSFATRCDQGGNSMAIEVYEGALVSPATIQFTTATMNVNSGTLNATCALFLQSTDNALPTTQAKSRIVNTRQ